MKKWTLMIYMAGDNNLSDDMVTALANVERFAGHLDDIAVTVFYDTSAVGVPTRYFDIGASTIAEVGESSASTDAIRRFIEWSIRAQKNEAEHYALILSGHGDGYLADTFLRDENPRGSISIWDLGDLLESVTAKRRGSKRFTIGKKFSVIGFDACVTNTIEVATQIDRAADIMVGSQGLIANSGWDYGRLLELLSAEDADLSEEGVSGAMAQAFADANSPHGKYCGRSADISVVDLRGGKIEAIAKKLHRLGRKLRRGLVSPTTSKAFKRLILEAHYHCQTVVFDQAVDIADFSNWLAEGASEMVAYHKRILDAAPESELAAESKAKIAKLSAVAELARAITESVVSCAWTSKIGPERFWCAGLSLFFPWSCQSYLLSRPNYLDYGFASAKKGKSVGWVEFLDTYLAMTMRMPENAESVALNLDAGTEAGIAAGTDAIPGKLTPPWTRLTPPWTRLTPPWTRLTPPWTRLTPPWTRLTPPWTRLTPLTGRFDPVISKFTHPVGKKSRHLSHSSRPQRLTNASSDSIETFRRFKNTPWIATEVLEGE